MMRGIIALVFRCKIIGGRLCTNDEAVAFRWADEHDITDLATKAYAVRDLDGIRDSGRAFVRHHDGTELV